MKCVKLFAVSDWRWLWSYRTYKFADTRTVREATWSYQLIWVNLHWRFFKPWPMLADVYCNSNKIITLLHLPDVLFLPRTACPENCSLIASVYYWTCAVTWSHRSIGNYKWNSSSWTTFFPWPFSTSVCTLWRPERQWLKVLIRISIHWKSEIRSHFLVA